MPAGTDLTEHHRRDLPAGYEMNSAEVILRARRLCKAFEGQRILDEVDLELRRGEVVLLEGENGSGKTTLLNILSGHTAPDAGTIEYRLTRGRAVYQFPNRRGKVFRRGARFTADSVARLGVGRVWQEVRLFGSQALRDNLAVALRDNPGESPMGALFAWRRVAEFEQSATHLADRSLTRLGLVGRQQSSGDRISLGQSKRAAIARAVIAGAEILLLDEPLAGLDREGIRDVLRLLTELAKKRSVTLVIVEHLFNQPHLQSLVTVGWLLKDSSLQIVPPVGFQRSAPGAEGRSDAQPTWLTHLAEAGSVSVEGPALPRGAWLTVVKGRRTPYGEAPPALEVKDLVVRRGNRTVIGLDESGSPIGLSFCVGMGERVVLHAPNGWGKTTLVDAIAGLLPIVAGEIRLFGRSIAKLPAWRRTALGLAVLRSGNIGFPHLSVAEFYDVSGGGQTLPELPATVAKHRRFATLSGGERQVLALASLALGRLTVLDEPFSALDENNFLRYCVPILRTAETTLIMVPARAETS